jgi:mannose-6-phosphate isomerase-like protein (cupin superfamily)
VIVSGRAVLVFDSGEVELGPGDCLVQQGSWHAWRIPWEKPCVLVGVSLRPGR